MKISKLSYHDFLLSKIEIAPDSGFDIKPEEEEEE